MVENGVVAIAIVEEEMKVAGEDEDSGPIRDEEGDNEGNMSFLYKCYIV